ncbi:MAG TPA: DUF192 domain-containing protein [Candidatus Dormibacteraeota bacterium]|nr:DUF192 domain-containing protein [Candidatus Dormibacteraeota bacterium]
MPVLVNATQARPIAANVLEAVSAWERVKGFLGRSEIGADDGIWFGRCDAVHTIGMRVTIDVVFLDERQAVVHLAEAVPPGRLYVGRRGARTVVELAGGAARRQGLAVGDVLALGDPHGFGVEQERGHGLG